MLENIGTPGTAHWSRAVAQKYITERFTPLVMDMMMPLNMLENGVDESEALRRSAAGRADMSLHAETWISLAAEIIAEVMSKRLYEVIVSGEVETNEILADDLEVRTCMQWNQVITNQMTGHHRNRSCSRSPGKRAS